MCNGDGEMVTGNEPGFTFHGYVTPTGDEEYDNVCVDLEKVIKGGRVDKSIILSVSP